MTDDYIDTREGWHEVSPDDAYNKPRLAYIEPDKEPRYWVREEPVSPLPTEPWTVALFFGSKFAERGSVLVLNDVGEWWPLYGRGGYWDRADTLKYDRFKVLAEPRAAEFEVER